MLVPIPYHQESEEHTSKMGRMSHTVGRGAYGREELYCHISYHKPLRLDGEGEGDDEETLVRECHTEG